MEPYRNMERRSGLPFGMKVFLAAAIAALSLTILWVGSGAVGPFISEMVKGFGTFFTNIGTAAGSTKPTEAPLVGDAPVIDPPDQPYTNADTIDVTVTIPAADVGQTGHSVRLYVALADGAPGVVAEKPVGALSKVTLPGVPLSNGRNDFTATIVGPGGETEASPVVTWIQDTAKPKLTVTSPKDGTQVAKSPVTFKGKSQANATIRLQNTTSGAVASATAAADGAWEASLALSQGVNAITITATDPAGNESTSSLTVRLGEGHMTVQVSGTAYRFNVAKLPKAVTFTAAIRGADGQPLAGAVVLFTVSVPGLEAIVSGEVVTDGTGVATFSTTIPAGAMPGSGLVTALVSTSDGQTATDRAVLTVE